MSFTFIHSTVCHSLYKVLDNTEAKLGKVLRISDELTKKGVLIVEATATNTRQFRHVWNISGETMVLAKDLVSAHIISPVRETSSIWTEYDPDSTGKKDKPAELKKSNKKNRTNLGTKKRSLRNKYEKWTSDPQTYHT